MSARTLFDKIWDSHLVVEEPGAPALLYVDLHLVHEVTSPQAFEGLRAEGRQVRRPAQVVATMDHNVPTTADVLGGADEISRAQMETLRRNCEESGITCFGVGHRWQGIVHVIGPELGLTLPAPSSSAATPTPPPMAPSEPSPWGSAPRRSSTSWPPSACASSGRGPWR